MEKSIFTVFVPMEDQEQCLRMKQLCLDNNLKIDEILNFFEFDGMYKWFFCDQAFEEFAVWGYSPKFHTQVTEADFINLLKDYTNQ